MFSCVSQVSLPNNTFFAEVDRCFELEIFVKFGKLQRICFKPNAKLIGSYYHWTHTIYFHFEAWVLHVSMISPLCQPLSQYCQLVWSNLLLTPLETWAGHVLPDLMKPPILSMVEPIRQVVLPVGTRRYLSSLDEVFCNTCKHLVPSVLSMFVMQKMWD